MASPESSDLPDVGKIEKGRAHYHFLLLLWLNIIWKVGKGLKYLKLNQFSYNHIIAFFLFVIFEFP